MSDRLDCDLVIFDMDGTLTRPNLDFNEIRAAIGLNGEPILEALEKMSSVERARAERILQEFEDAAAHGSELQVGAADIVPAIRKAGRAAALMTRNSARSVEIVRNRHRIEFDFIRTRDDGPIKPAPDPVLDICSELDVEPRRACVIGDYHYDLLCANAAGAASVHYAADFAELPTWSSDASHVVRSMSDFASLIGVTIPAAAADS